MTQIYATKFFFDGLDFGLIIADRKLTHGIGGNSSEFMVISNLNRQDDEICKIEKSGNTLYANAGSDLNDPSHSTHPALGKLYGIEKTVEMYRALSEDKKKYFQALAIYHDGDTHIMSFSAEDGVIRMDSQLRRIYAASMPSLDSIRYIEHIDHAEDRFTFDGSIIMHGNYKPTPDRLVSLLRKMILNDSMTSSAMGIQTISRNVNIGIVGHPDLPWLNEGCMKIDFYESFPDFWNPDGRYNGFPTYHMPIPQAKFYRKVEWTMDHSDHIEQKNLLYRIAFPGLRDIISSLCIEQEILDKYMRQTTHDIIGEFENANLPRKMLSERAINNRMMSVKRIIDNYDKMWHRYTD